MAAPDRVDGRDEPGHDAQEFAPVTHTYHFFTLSLRSGHAALAEPSLRAEGEAIHAAATQRRHGLLRFARNDGIGKGPAERLF